MSDVRVVTVAVDELRAIVAESVAQALAARETPLDAEEFLNQAQVAELLGVTSATIRNLRRRPKEGFPEPARVGTSLRYRRSEVLEYAKRTKAA